jgi:hypothetical protein
MRNFRPFSTTFAAVVVSALASACGSYGDPCLRSTDCGSGLVCVEGKCIVDLGDSPADGAPPIDVSPGDAGSSDTAGRDTSTAPDTASDGGPAPSTDSAADSPGSDASRDVAADGDAASFDAIDVTSLDGDARAQAEPDVSTDVVGVDVGNVVDSASARDALFDATDAAG